MPRKPEIDSDVLLAALDGLELQRQRIDDQIAEVRRLLGSRGGTPTAPAAPGRKRTMSPAAKKRIGEAQKRRWAAFRKTSEQRAESAEKTKAAKSSRKRKMSAAGRKRIAEASRRRWAEFRKARQNRAGA